ncbi:MAG: FkbM family methyltransferase [Pirellulaceae bacterium]|nr:FkbM family methyltransferase [Pirellulaceae bacterium]
MHHPAILSGGFNQLRQCRHGYMLYNVHDVYIGRSLDLYGEFSEGEVDTFRKVLRPGEWVLDIGANIGAHTLALSQIVGPQGRVYAFEPQRILFQTLCANLALNGVTNAYCHHSAVGESPGKLLVPPLNYAAENNFGGVSLGNYPAGEPVEVLTIDSLALPSCRMLKIDVEGMELAVLRGAAQTIQRFKPILYVENDRAQNSAALTELIHSHGYHMYWHLPPYFSAENFYQNPHNVFGNIVSGNLLCTHPAVGPTIVGLRQCQPGEPIPFGR